MGVEELASYRRCIERQERAWPGFLSRRKQMLEQYGRRGAPTEKVAENIVADALVEVLDWPRANINFGVGYADILLMDRGLRRLIIETKRPDALAWNRHAVDQALEQARGYADEQGVQTIAVSDGRMLYAADLVHGGLRDRLFVALDAESPPRDLWWVSVHGVYRDRTDGASSAALDLLPKPDAAHADDPPGFEDGRLHPKYQLPARCFAYVGRADDPRTWKLPYLLSDGSVDRKRLPKAIGAMVTNYRGEGARSVPLDAAPAVLVRLANAARLLGLMPPQAVSPAPTYRQLAAQLESLERTGDI